MRLLLLNAATYIASVFSRASTLSNGSKSQFPASEAKLVPLRRHNSHRNVQTLTVSTAKQRSRLSGFLGLLCLTGIVLLLWKSESDSQPGAEPRHDSPRWPRARRHRLFATLCLFGAALLLLPAQAMTSWSSAASSRISVTTAEFCPESVSVHLAPSSINAGASVPYLRATISFPDSPFQGHFQSNFDPTAVFLGLEPDPGAIQGIPDRSQGASNRSVVLFDMDQVRKLLSGMEHQDVVPLVFTGTVGSCEFSGMANVKYLVPQGPRNEDPEELEGEIEALKEEEGIDEAKQEEDEDSDDEQDGTEADDQEARQEEGDEDDEPETDTEGQPDGDDGDGWEDIDVENDDVEPESSSDDNSQQEDDQDSDGDGSDEDESEPSSEDESYSGDDEYRNDVPDEDIDDEDNGEDQTDSDAGELTVETSTIDVDDDGTDDDRASDEDDEPDLTSETEALEEDVDSGEPESTFSEDEAEQEDQVEDLDADDEDESTDTPPEDQVESEEDEDQTSDESEAAESPPEDEDENEDPDDALKGENGEDDGNPDEEVDHSEPAHDESDGYESEVDSPEDQGDADDADDGDTDEAEDLLPVPFEPTHQVAAGPNVILRADPGPASEALLELIPGTALQFLEEDVTVDGVTWMYFATDDGTTGWLSEDDVVDYGADLDEGEEEQTEVEPDEEPDPESEPEPEPLSEPESESEPESDPEPDQSQAPEMKEESQSESVTGEEEKEEDSN